MKVLRIFTALCFTLLLIIPMTSTAQSGLEDIPYQGTDGQDYIFANLLGEKYLLVDAFATWCGPCKKAAPHIQELIDYRGEVVSVFSLSIDPDTDNPNTVKQFAESAGFTWPAGIDTTRQFQENFPTINLPTYFLFAPNGTLVYQFTIEEVSSGIDYIHIIDRYVPSNLTSLPTESTEGDGLLQLIALSLLIGFLTSLSPCLFPMMPTYFTIVANDNKTSKPKILLSVLVLGSGVMIVFSALGLLYNAAIGTFLISNYSSFLLVQGLLLLIAGVLLIWTPKFILNIALPSSLNNLMYSEKVQGNTILLSFIVGLFYTIIAAPCAFSYFLWEWSLVLAQPMSIKILSFFFFTLGAIIPFFGIALFLPEIKTQFSKRIQKGSNIAKYLFGAVLLIIGLYLILGSRGIVPFFF